MGNKTSLMLQDVEIQQISEETGFSPSQIEKLYARFAHLDRTSCGTLNKNDLLSIPELAINPLCDRLVHMFFTDSHQTDERINFKQFIKVLSIFKPSSSNTITLPKIKDEPLLSRRKSLETRLQARQMASKLTSRFHRPTHNGKIENNESLPKTIKTTNSSVDNVTERYRDQLLFIFSIYDADNDGKINFNDLKSILKLMVGNYVEEVQLNKIVAKAFFEVDKDNNGFIEFSEFCRVFNRKVLEDKLRVKFFT